MAPLLNAFHAAVVRQHGTAVALAGLALVVAGCSMLAHADFSNTPVDNLLEERHTVSGQSWRKLPRETRAANEAVLVQNHVSSEQVAAAIANVAAPACTTHAPPAMRTNGTQTACPLSRYASFGYATLSVCLAAKHVLKPWRNASGAPLAALDPNTWGLDAMPCATASPALCFREGERLLPPGFARELRQGGLALAILELCESESGACAACHAYVREKLDEATEQTACSNHDPAAKNGTAALADLVLDTYVPLFAAYTHHLARPSVHDVQSAVAGDADARARLGWSNASIEEYVRHAYAHAASALRHTPAAVAAVDQGTGGIAHAPFGSHTRACLQPDAPCCLAWDGMTLAPPPRLSFAPAPASPVVLLRAMLAPNSTDLPIPPKDAVWLELPATVDAARKGIFDEHAANVCSLAAAIATVGAAALAALSLHKATVEDPPPVPIPTRPPYVLAAATAMCHAALGVLAATAALHMSTRRACGPETTLPAYCLIASVCAPAGGYAGCCAGVSRHRHLCTPGGLVEASRIAFHAFAASLQALYLRLAFLVFVMAASASTSERLNFAHAAFVMGHAAFLAQSLFFAPIVLWAASLSTLTMGEFVTDARRTAESAESAKGAAGGGGDDVEMAAVGTKAKLRVAETPATAPPAPTEPAEATVGLAAHVLLGCLCAASAVLGLAFCLDPAFDVNPKAPPLSAYGFAADDDGRVPRALRAYERDFGPHAEGAIIQAYHASSMMSDGELRNPSATDRAMRAASQGVTDETCAACPPTALSGQPSGLAAALACPAAIKARIGAQLAEAASDAAYRAAIYLGDDDRAPASDDYRLSEEETDGADVWGALNAAFEARRESLEALYRNAAYRGGMCGVADAFAREVVVASVNTNGRAPCAIPEGAVVLPAPDATVAAAGAIAGVDFRKGAGASNASCAPTLPEWTAGLQVPGLSFWHAQGLYHARGLHESGVTLAVPIVSDGEGGRSVRAARNRMDGVGDLAASPSASGGAEPLRTLRDAALAALFALVGGGVLLVVLGHPSSTAMASGVAGLAAATCTLSACLRMGVLAYGAVGTFAPALSAWLTQGLSADVLRGGWATCVHACTVCAVFVLGLVPLSGLGEAVSRGALWAGSSAVAMSMVWGVVLSKLVVCLVRAVVVVRG